MGSAFDMIKPVAENARRANPPGPGDYIDEEGLLVCGKCNTRKETVIMLPDPSNPSVKRPLKVAVMCQCRQQAFDREKEAERRREAMDIVDTLKRQSLLDERLSEADFSTYQRNRYNEQNLKLSLRYAQHFDQMLKRNQGLLFYGGIGTGKSYTAACIANHLLNRQVPVVMTSFIKLLDMMQGFKDDTALIRRLNLAKLLIIDDLGAERGTDFALEKVYDIVDSRYRAKLPMILTTNLSIEEMKATTDIRYARIYDRIFESCYPMQFTGGSWRKAEASRRFSEMQEFLEGLD